MDISNHGGGFGGGGGKSTPNIFFGEDTPKIKEGIWVKDAIKPKKIKMLEDSPLIDSVIGFHNTVPVPGIGGDIQDCVQIGTKVHMIRKLAQYGVDFIHVTFDLETEKWELIKRWTFAKDTVYATLSGDSEHLYMVVSKINEVWKYTVATNTWELLGVTTAIIEKTVSTYVDGYIYIVTCKNASSSCQFLKISVSDLSFVQIQGLATTNSYTAMTRDGNIIYIYLGFSSNTSTAYLYGYDLTTGLLTTTAESTSEYVSGLAMHNGSLYVAKTSSAGFTLGVVDVGTGKTTHLATNTQKNKLYQNRLAMISYGGYLICFSDTGILKYQEGMPKLINPDNIPVLPPGRTSYHGTYSFMNKDYVVFAMSEGKSIDVYDRKTKEWTNKVNNDVTVTGNGTRIITDEYFYYFTRVDGSRMFSWRYKFSTGEFQSLPESPQILGTVSKTIYKGDIYLFGTQASYSGVMKFDTKNLVWSVESNSLLGGTYGGGASTVGDITYITGRFASSYVSAYAYNHHTKLFSSINNSPASVINTQTVPYLNGFYLGGTDSSKNSLIYYDASTNIYTSVIVTLFDAYNTNMFAIGNTINIMSVTAFQQYTHIVSHEPDDTFVIDIAEPGAIESGILLDVNMPGKYTGMVRVKAHVKEGYYFKDGTPTPTINIQGNMTKPW